jgi:hypothetical protein
MSDLLVGALRQFRHNHGNGTYVFAYDAGETMKVVDALQAELAELRKDRDRLKKAVDAVCDLIENSQGVYGLHLNGDPASWPSLLQGGMFEEWLVDFSEAVGHGVALDKDAGGEG